MDKQIKKIDKSNEKTVANSKKVGKELKGLLKMDKKQDKRIETMEHQKKR